MEVYKGANFYGRAHTALILYSSGTTGLPKGVTLTHLNYITTAYQVPLPNLHHVLQGYGMTETSGVIAKENDHTQKFGSVGKVAAGLLAKIVDIETRKTLGPGQQGELCVKGSSVLENYVGKDMDEFFENGYFKTGYIAYYDEEGFIFVVDRLKELLKYKGWQVPPSELEAVMLQHPSVRDAAVVGAPDRDCGELPTAFIVMKPGFEVTSQEIIKFVDSKVSPWKRLRGGPRFVEEIPKNPSGKILRRLLRGSLIKPASKL